MTAYDDGRQARRDGKTVNDNPYIIGRTKLGAPRLSDEGVEWERGFSSIGRTASAKEIADAARLDVSRFRRKPNRFYE